MVIEARWGFYSKLEQKFWQEMLRYQASHKGNSIVASFPSFTHYKGPFQVTMP